MMKTIKHVVVFLSDVEGNYYGIADAPVLNIEHVLGWLGNDDRNAKALEDVAPADSATVVYPRRHIVGVGMIRAGYSLTLHGDYVDVTMIDDNGCTQETSIRRSTLQKLQDTEWDTVYEYSETPVPHLRFGDTAFVFEDLDSKEEFYDELDRVIQDNSIETVRAFVQDAVWGCEDEVIAAFLAERKREVAQLQLAAPDEVALAQREYEFLCSVLQEEEE